MGMKGKLFVPPSLTCWNEILLSPKGLADHKDSLGAPLCPCRHYDDKAAEAAQGFWNCPCVPMRE
ncbi:ferredoxin-thioredoxin reductase catalytic chain chloroplastic-like, partial [Trifolium medium]|nr:ferredoxin-thioredoxin reductase catalytic chain chloroplastic-like [Trifolium medium]